MVPFVLVLLVYAFMVYLGYVLLVWDWKRMFPDLATKGDAVTLLAISVLGCWIFIPYLGITYIIVKCGYTSSLYERYKLWKKKPL